MDDKINIVKMDNGMIGVYLDNRLIYSEQKGSFRLESLFQRLGYEAETHFKEILYPMPDKLDF